MKCHDCGVEEGQLHLVGCDMEVCPSCFGQLISCGCFGSDDALPFRIPFFVEPVMCAQCGALWPDFFMVPDSEWIKYVPPQLREEVLCRGCYGRLVKLWPDGWRNVEEGS